MSVTHEATFEPETRSVRATRAFVASAVDLPADLRPRVALLVSELASNAVIHARTEFLVRITESFGTLRVSVRDNSLAIPTVKHYSVEASTGRGLRLVDAMADRWGIETGDLGKAVWFELDLVDPGVARSA